MPLIIPATYGQATIHFGSTLFVGGTAAVTFGLGGVDEESISAQDAANSLRAHLNTTLPPFLDSDISVVRVEVVSSEQRGENLDVIAGTRAGEGPPPNLAVLVRKNVDGRGRRRQGRMYWPGLLTETEVNQGGVITSTRQDQIQGLMNGLWAWADSLPGSMVILQNSEGETPPLNPPPVVTSLQVDARCATQRRRMRR